jgi:hypothetical protein
MSNRGVAPDQHGHVLLQDPPLARFLFQSTIASWGWLILRVWAGLQFCRLARPSLNEPAWMDGSGAGIRGFWTNALGNRQWRTDHYLRLIQELPAAPGK